MEGSPLEMCSGCHCSRLGASLFIKRTPCQHYNENRQIHLLPEPQSEGEGTVVDDSGCCAAVIDDARVCGRWEGARSVWMSVLRIVGHSSI